MKIEIPERGSKEYYDEYLYILTKYKKLINNPHIKITKLTNESFRLCLLSIIMTILMFIIFIINTDNKVFLYLGIFFILLIILSVIYYYIITTNINKLRSNKGLITIEFNKDKIQYITKDKQLDILWDDIKYIIINKYTITFIPYEINKTILSINITYKEELFKILKKLKKEDLIVK